MAGWDLNVRSPTLRRRSFMYVAILGVCSVILVIGLGALTVVRIERRDSAMMNDFAQARMHAQSAIEMGLLRIAQDPNWRTDYPNGIWEADRPIGSGTYTLEGIDPVDGDLLDEIADPLVLKAAGMEGGAVYRLQVRLEAQMDPIEALATAIHANEIDVMGGKALTATGAPVSTNGLLQLAGGATVYGDVEVGSLSNGGTITGTVTNPAPPKAMPDAGVFDSYAAKATPIAVPNTIDRQVLAPGYNPWGTTNPDGVYLITMSGGTLKIQDTRIHGTLLVDNPAGNVVLDKAVLMEPARADYPVLVVRGPVELLFPSDGNVLDEAGLATNFNPAGAPYQGISDADTGDSYPSEIYGLVHMTGTLRLKTTARVHGVVICESIVTADDANEIVYDPDLYTNPPQGYTTPPVMTIVPGTWTRVVE